LHEKKKTKAQLGYHIFFVAGGRRHIGIAIEGDRDLDIDRSTQELTFPERSPSLYTLFICLPLFREKRDAMLDCKDSESGNGKEDEQHDDDDRDGNVALDHLV
jgi:hypothetical protein